MLPILAIFALLLEAVGASAECGNIAGIVFCGVGNCWPWPSGGQINETSGLTKSECSQMCAQIAECLAVEWNIMCPASGAPAACNGAVLPPRCIMWKGKPESFQPRAPGADSEVCCSRSPANCAKAVGLDGAACSSDPANYGCSASTPTPTVSSTTFPCRMLAVHVIMTMSVAMLTVEVHTDAR